MNWYKLRTYVFVTDIDECLLSPPVCPHLSECINSAGSYDCQCYSGYRYDGGSSCEGERVLYSCGCVCVV